MFGGEYLINPWCIYLINLIEPVNKLLCSLVFITGIIIFFALLGLTLSSKDDEEYRLSIRAMKITSPIFIICGFLAIFTPTKDTLIQMYVASLTTPENLQALGAGIKGVGSDIKDVSVAISEFLKGSLLDVIREVKR